MIKTESPAQLTLRILAQKTFDEVQTFLIKFQDAFPMRTNMGHDAYMEDVKLLQVARISVINTLGWTLSEYNLELVKRSMMPGVE